MSAVTGSRTSTYNQVHKSFEHHDRHCTSYLLPRCAGLWYPLYPLSFGLSNT
jgi:hypothetical protein